MKRRKMKISLVKDEKAIHGRVFRGELVISGLYRTKRDPRSG